MVFNPLTSERMACAILAAQVTALRERIDAGPTVALLYQACDLLARLAALIEQLAGANPGLAAPLRADCASALASGIDITQAIDDLAFEQAQRNDFICQTVDCVVTALGRLSAGDKPPGYRLTAGDLQALYVGADQHDVHADAVRQFALDAFPRQIGVEIRQPEALQK
jgi:phage tail protein X